MAPQMQSDLIGGVAEPPLGLLEKTGTLTTPQGPITWTQSSDGTIHAEGGGQTLTASGHDGSDGSWQKHADYARTGQAPYLTMESIGDAAQRKVAFTLSAGSSRLTLTVANIDAGVTSGTAILTGTWNGAAVNWTGHADLTSNPLVGRPIAGWPAGAFATELREAAFFAPLGNALAPKVIAPVPVVVGDGGMHHGGIHPMGSVGGVIARAGGWCMAGAMGGSVLAPETLGTSMLLGCAGGASASLFGEFVTWLDESGPIIDPGPVIDPLPPINPPTDPEPTGPTTQTQPDDPPPPSSGGDGPGSEPPTGSGGAGGQGDEGEGDGGGGGGRFGDDKPPLKDD